MGKITVVFNNLESDKRLKTGWGSSFLIEHESLLILFDTGADGKSLLFNFDVLNIDRRSINKIVISHNHPDHTGGLERILQVNPGKIDVYLPVRLAGGLWERLQPLSRQIVIVKNKEEIAKDIYITPIKGLRIKEQVLTIDSSRGLILLVGCAHAGICKISRMIKDDFDKDIYALFGGFHFEYYPSLFVKILGYLLKHLDIEIIGPDHCTGERAIKVLRSIFKEGFVNFGCGNRWLYG